MSNKDFEKSRSDSIRDELSRLSPGLAELHDKRTYQVPEGYFDMLHTRIVNRTMNRELSVQRRMLVPRSWLHVAASILLLFGALVLSQWNVNAPKNFTGRDDFDEVYELLVQTSESVDIEYLIEYAIDEGIFDNDEL